MKPKIIKIPGKTKSGISIIEEKCFRYMVEKLGYTKKKMNKEFGIGHRLWHLSLITYYTPLQVEELRRKKIMSSRQSVRPVRWRERALILEKFKPGITQLVEQADYKEALQLIQNLNHEIHEAKEALRLVLKHLRHGGKRRGITINLVANALEFRVEKILKKLGLEYQCQYRIGKRYYDFKVGKLLIEVDGRYHNDKVDTIKNRLANKKGYILLRLPEKEIQYAEIITDKINQANRQANSL